MGRILFSMGVCILLVVISYRIKWSAAVSLLAAISYAVVLQVQPLTNSSYTQIEDQTEEVSYLDNKNK